MIGKIRNLNTSSGGGAELVIVDNTKTNSEYAEFYTQINGGGSGSFNKFVNNSGWLYGYTNDNKSHGTCIFSITKAIDVTNYKTLSLVHLGSGSPIGISQNATSADFDAYIVMPNDLTSPKTYTIDVSEVKGNVYIKATKTGSSTSTYNYSTTISDLRFTRKPIS